jgi:NAD(P)H-quinone oxidoreductase subunit 5
MQPDLPLSIQYVWLIPLYGFSGMFLSLPWAAGWFKRQGPRPAAYLNLIMTLLGVIHGSLVLQQILQLGAQHLQFDWFGVGDMNLQIGFELSLTNLAALEFVTAMSLLGQVFALGYLDKEWSLARFYALVGFFEGAICFSAFSCWRCLLYQHICLLVFGMHSHWLLQLRGMHSLQSVLEMYCC